MRWPSGQNLPCTHAEPAFYLEPEAILSSLMAYRQATGDPRAIEAAGQLADPYRDYLGNGDRARRRSYNRARNDQLPGYLGDEHETIALPERVLHLQPADDCHSPDQPAC